MHGAGYRRHLGLVSLHSLYGETQWQRPYEEAVRVCLGPRETTPRRVGQSQEWPGGRYEKPIEGRFLSGRAEDGAALTGLVVRREEARDLVSREGRAAGNFRFRR